MEKLIGKPTNIPYFHLEKKQKEPCRLGENVFFFSIIQRLIVPRDLGDYKKARVLMEKALASNEKKFGKAHPATTIRYSNLAGLLMYLSDYETALELSAKAVAIFRKSLPEEHSNIKTAEEVHEAIKEKIKGRFIYNRTLAEYFKMIQVA